MSNRMEAAHNALHGKHVPYKARRVYGYLSNRQNLVDAIQGYKNRSSLQKADPSAYSYLRRHGLLDIAFPPEANPKPRDYWTVERIQSLIDEHKCRNLNQLRRHAHYAAERAYKLGLHKGQLRFHGA